MAAHFIVGIVNNAKDATSADGRVVLLWNPANGIADNLTDIIGPGGNSGTSNIYMVDCEMLSNPCRIGDEIRVMVINESSVYITNYTNITVTGSGFNIAGNLTLNSPPNITSLVVDDSAQPPTFPADQIDLIAASTREVICLGAVEEYDGDPVQNASARFFHFGSSYGSSDDYNDHYTNSSCYINDSYGNENQSEISCIFQVEYYASPGEWNCTITLEDGLLASSMKSDSSSINPLLSVGVISAVDFGLINASRVSSEKEINITNYGNVKINLSLSGYASSVDDGFAMNCTLGGNISIEHEKYNLTASNAGELSLLQAGNLYANLTMNPDTKKFDLNYRQDDYSNEAINSTYWRIYVPAGVGGACEGRIVFGASVSPGT